MNLIDYTNYKLKSCLLELGFGDFITSRKRYSCNIKIGSYHIFITHFTMLNTLALSLWDISKDNFELAWDIDCSETLIEDFISAITYLLYDIKYSKQYEVTELITKLELLKAKI